MYQSRSPGGHPEQGEEIIIVIPNSSFVGGGEALATRVRSSDDWVKCQMKLSVIGGTTQLKWVSADNEGSVIKMMWRARQELPCETENNRVCAK